jgi:hypothetical protein
MQHTRFYPSLDSGRMQLIKNSYEIICIITLLVLSLRITNK